MASQAQTQTQTRVQPRQQQTRRFDQVYDPTYTCSAERDHVRAMSRAQNSSVTRVPDRQNYFSEIPTKYKNFVMVQQTKSDLPSHVQTDYRGSTNDAHYVKAASSLSAVSGKNRHKYFKRPVVPILHSAPPEILLAQDGWQVESRDEDSSGASSKRELSSKHYSADVVEEVDGQVTQGTQTIIRDSEAQTDPYTPDHYIPAGADPEPEILELAHLKFGQGLPITQQEVMMIERARFKKQFLAALPPITDEASFNLRKRMMEEQELREFKYREDEIDRLQSEHLRLLREALEEREAETEFLSEQRLVAMRQQRLQEKDQKLLAIQKQRIKHLRKLARSRAGVCPVRSTHEVIDEYSNFASKTYAPLLRDGVFNPSKVDSQQAARTELPNDLGMFMQLEALVDPRKSESGAAKSRRVKANTSREAPAANRKQQHLVHHLEWMDALIKSRKKHVEGEGDSSGDATDEQDTQTPMWRKRAEKLERPPTPRVARAKECSQLAKSHEVINAVALLQRLLRGRAIQTMMMEGKSKRLELIRELRTEELAEQALQDDQISNINEEPQFNTNSLLAKDIAKKSATEAIQGEVVSTTLDLLAKELTHVEQEQQVRVLAEAAIEKRKRREVIQAGTRQAEHMRRKRDDEVYRQLMLVHQGTVDSLFDEMLAGSIEEAATQTALSEILPGSLSQTASSLENSKQNPASSDKEVVHQLVSSFLLPHVQRESVRQQIQAEERRFVEAAHRSIYEVLSGFDEHDINKESATSSSDDSSE